MVTQRYEVSNEYNVAEMLGHLDSNYIFDMINDKLNSIDYSTTLPETNIVTAFEENFKFMNDQYPGDAVNIRAVREQVYRDIIFILCEKFNLRFNEEDDNIDPYTAATYIYEFLICKRNEIMINFFTSFIINNRESLCRILNIEDFKKTKDSAAAYSKHVYDDQKFALISANMNKVISHISTLDITLYNIFQSTYNNQEVINFMGNAFADKANFFQDQYCCVLKQPDVLPIIITNIRLELQKIVGNISQSNIHEIMAYGDGNISKEG